MSQDEPRVSLNDEQRRLVTYHLGNLFNGISSSNSSALYPQIARHLSPLVDFRINTEGVAEAVMLEIGAVALRPCPVYASVQESLLRTAGLLLSEQNRAGNILHADAMWQGYLVVKELADAADEARVDSVDAEKALGFYNPTHQAALKALTSLVIRKARMSSASLVR